jgi:hypothetical protein
VEASPPHSLRRIAGANFFSSPKAAGENGSEQQSLAKGEPSNNRPQIGERAPQFDEDQI